MIDYESMSDFEINKAVAFSLRYLVKTDFEQGLGGFTENYHRKYPNTIWAAKTDDSGEQCEAWEQMNFCAEPQDSWPIIADNMISIEFDVETNCDKPAAWCNASSPCGKEILHQNYKKPLRAAMIVYLMMNEVEQ